MPAVKAAKAAKTDASKAIQAFISLTSGSNGKICTCASYRVIRKIATRYPEILVEIYAEEQGRLIPDYAKAINASRCQVIDGYLDFGQKYEAVSYLADCTTWNYDTCVKAINKRINQLNTKSSKKKKPGGRRLQVD